MLSKIQPTLPYTRLLSRKQACSANPIVQPMPSYVVTMRREMDICSDAIKTVFRCERCEWMECIYHTADIADRRKEIQALKDFQVHNCADYPEKKKAS